MDIVNDIRMFNRMSIPLFYQSFPLLKNDSKYIENMPGIVDPEFVMMPEIRALGVEERWLYLRPQYMRKLIFKPHNFFEINHLDLPEFYFFRLQEKGEVRKSMKKQKEIFEEAHNEFSERCKRELLREIIRRIGNNAYPTAKFTRILIHYNRTVIGLKTLEAMSVARFCLNRLFERRGDCLNEIAVVEVLEEFFKSPLLKEDLVIGTVYTPECLAYVLECCTALKFNIKRFLTFNDQRQQQVPFCPVSSCILSGHGNIPKLKVLLSHGFEPQMLNLNMKQVTYVMVKMSVQMRYNGIDPAVVSRTQLFDGRRMYIILKFLYLVCCSLRRDEDICIETCKILFSSIPDPFVSRDEIFRLLYSMYHKKIPLEIVNRCSLFKDTYIPVSMPRTLKHLSRCVVRASLGENFHLPASTDFCLNLLQLPISLIQYLNLLEF